MKKLSTKEKIMNAAIDLFSKSGYDKVSMRDIAGEIGINAASIYNHFPSKNSILESILRDFMEQIQNRNSDPSFFSYLRENPTTDGIMAFIQFSFPRDNLDYYIKVMCVILQEQHRDPVIRQYVAETFLSTEQYIKTVFDMLKDFNIIRQDSDPDFWMKIASSLIYAFSNRVMLGVGDSLPNYSGMRLMELLRFMFDMMLKTCAVEDDRVMKSTESL